MEADRREAEIKEPISDMERGSDEMEQRLDELGEGIAGAKKTADQRQDAPGPKSGPDAGETAEEHEGETESEDEGAEAEAEAVSPEAQEQIDRGAEQRDRQAGDEDVVGDEAKGSSSDEDDDDDSDEDDDSDDSDDSDDDDSDDDDEQGTDAQAEIDRGVKERDPDGEPPPEDAR